MDQHYNFCNFLFLALTLIALSEEIYTRDSLPDISVPSHYSLDLVLDPTAETFDGLVEINFTHSNLTINSLKLHASENEIVIKTALLNYENACNLTGYVNDTQVVTLTCPENSLKEENVLTIEYQGTFSVDDMDGLYKSTYVDGDEKNVLLSTQFESESARKAFPCFDEPSLKATFDIFITHPNDYSALANTPVVKTFSKSSTQIQTQFATTPKMSTYLVAFVVSKFVSNIDDAKKDYDFQVYSRPNAKEFTSIATSYGPTLIDLLSNFTGISYVELGNTQAYQVAVPDFAAGAMENWGLITYREVDLLDEKEKTSNRAIQRILTTVAHELSHQWFGDYVTLDWWSNLWLNEGFATYFEYFIPDQLIDNLETMKQFVVNELQLAFQVDALASALPLSSDVDTAAEVGDKFDDISYSKGGSIVRMLRNILGESSFENGLQTYLTTNKYGNGNPSKLLAALKEETELDLNTTMHNWIYKSGYPLVNVTLNGSAVVLSQERFTLQNTSEVDATQWYIPISYTTGEEKNFNVNISDWLEPNSVLTIPFEDTSNNWIIFNIQEAGYYRVLYDMTLLHRLIAALEDDIDNIDPLNRAQLIDDAFNTARAGRHSYEMAFHLAKYLVSETSYYPWVSALNALSFIRGKLDDNEAERLLEDKIYYWLDKAFPFKETDFGTEHVDKLKEALVKDWTCKLGQKQCTQYANETFQNFKLNSSLPDYNLRSVVFCHGLANSPNPSEDFDFLFNLFKNTTSVVEQNEIISALGCTTDADLLAKYLFETIATNSSIRKQDTIYVFRTILNNNAGLNISLDFLENNLEKIVEAYKGLNALPNMILGIAQKVISHDHIDRLTKIIEDNSNIEEVQLIQQRAIDYMATNRLWTDTYAAEIKKILKSSANAASAVSLKILSLMLAIVFYLSKN